MRLIDADSLHNAFCSCCDPHTPCTEEDASICLAHRLIKDEPTAINIWIPCSEKLPEIGFDVLVTRQKDKGARYRKIATYQGDCWMDNSDEYGKPNPDPVIAWTPIPDVYKLYESDGEKMEKIPFIVALAVGGVMEHPDYVYEDKQVIWACDEEEAVRIYNENNNCSYYYGKVIGIARDQMY